MPSSARAARFSQQQSSTATSVDVRLRRCPSSRVRSRADLPGAGDPSVGLVRGQAGGALTVAPLAPSPAGRGLAGEDPDDTCGPFRALWCAEDVAPAAAGRGSGGEMHCDPPDGRVWAPARRAPGADLHQRPEAQAADLAQQRFTASRPNKLLVADFTYVASLLGFVYVAFMIDVFSRRIKG
jgi:hypothetical protein